MTCDLSYDDNERMKWNIPPKIPADSGRVCDRLHRIEGSTIKWRRNRMYECYK
jgi:hypothetical protein